MSLVSKFTQSAKCQKAAGKCVSVAKVIGIGGGILLGFAAFHMAFCGMVDGYEYVKKAVSSPAQP